MDFINRGDNLRIPKIFTAILLVLMVAGAFGQRPVELMPEPDYTYGNSNTLCWDPSGAVPVAYQVAIDTASEGDADFADPEIIGPISLSAIVDNCYEVSGPTTGSEPRLSGVRYCYKVRYRYYEPTIGENAWSEWSNIVCSTQDADPPSFEVTELPIWTNTPSSMIEFNTNDFLCGCVDSVFLYYRQDESEAWILDNSIDFDGCSGIGEIRFNSADATGDGYYEFYLSGKDTLGNFRAPVVGFHSKMTWTRFDTDKPVSAIDTEGMTPYYIVNNVDIAYAGSDTYSGIERVELISVRNDVVSTFATDVYDGDLEVAGDFAFNVVEDGEYRLYTQAYDSAGNPEYLEDLDDVFFSIDTEEPVYSDMMTYDATTAPSREEVPAEANWSNANLIKVEAIDPEDPINDDYSSMIDSVYISESNDFDVNTQIFAWEGSAIFDYNLSDEDGEKEVFFRMKDKAGNFSHVDSNMIILDLQHPEIENVRLADADYPTRETEDTDDNRIAVLITPDETTGSHYMMYLTDNEADLDYIRNEDWLPYEDMTYFTFEEASPGEIMTIYVVLKDSAGNVSEVTATDDIYYMPDTYFFVEFHSITDVDYPDARDGFTNHHLVDIEIEFGRDVDSIVIWNEGEESWSISVSTEGELTAIETINDFPLVDVDGIRTVYAHGKNPVNVLPTTTSEISITLDKVRPELDSITCRDLTDSLAFDVALRAEAADYGYTNEVDINVTFNDATDELSGLYYCRVICDGVESMLPYAPTVMFELPEGDSPKTVEGSVQDSAGNWSLVYLKDIELDTHAPIFESITLLDMTTGFEESTDDTLLQVRMIANDGTAGEPAYIAFFENPDLYPEDLHGLWQPYESTMEAFISYIPGERRLYAALKDRAGNISEIVHDDILLINDINLDLVLSDLDSDSHEYTNSNNISVLLNTTGDEPAFFFLSEESEAPELNDPRWLTFPPADEDTFTLTPEEGEKTVYGWVKSEAGIISPMDSDVITLDKTAPELVEGFQILDRTTDEEFPTSFIAHMGWSNEPQVWAVMLDVEDTWSGVDSLGFFGNLVEPWLPIPYSVASGGITVEYNPMVDSLPITFDSTTVGQKWITGRALDGAGNWGNEYDLNSEVIVYGGYDTEPPTIDLLSPLTEESMDSIGSTIPSSFPCHITDGPDGGHLWKVCFNFPEIEDTVICVEYDSTWGEGPVYEVTFPMYDLLEWNRLYEMHVVSIDSAGNPSPVDMINFWTIPDTSTPELILTDIVDIEDSEYTNSLRVRTVIEYESSVADSMMFSEDPSMLGAVWQPFSIEGSYDFISGSNTTKTVYCKIKHGRVVSPIFSSTIILDTTVPTVQEIVAKDKDTHDPFLSNEREVLIEIVNPYDAAPGMLASLECAENPDFEGSTVLPFDPSDEVLEVLYTVAEEPTYEDDPTPGAEDQRVIYARVLDRAENHSSNVVYKIIVDYETLEVTNHPNPFNPDEGSTYIRIKSDDNNETPKISIYDMFGGLVREMERSFPSDGYSINVEWDGENGNGDVVASGVYICIVEIGNETYKRKIAVWKGGE